MRRTTQFGRGRPAGFTLVEVVITVAIVGILAAIAYPSYISQIQKVRRADAQTVLMQNAQYLQRINTQTGCYNPGTDMNCNSGTPANLDLPYTQSPIDGSTGYYAIAYNDTPPSGALYQLVATPVSGTSQEGTGTLTLDNVGRKTSNGETGW